MRGDIIRLFVGAYPELFAPQSAVESGSGTISAVDDESPEQLRQFQVMADDGCPHFPEDNDYPVASLCPAIAELERAFRAFCDLAFKRQMPLPVITIQTRGRRRVLGWFWEEKWKNGRPLRLPEINICPEYLAHDVEDIAQVLLHEMCHYANYLSGIRDCSSSQYHNRKFKRRCDSIGLVCTKSRRGWAHTELSPDLRAIVYRVKLDPGVFSLYRAGPQYRLVAAAPERRLRRWMCECKKSKVIYASRGLEVTCNKCFKVYQETPLGKY